MGSKTAEMIAQILRGETPPPVENPVVANRTEQDILRSVGEVYREILEPKQGEKQ